MSTEPRLSNSRLRRLCWWSWCSGIADYGLLMGTTASLEGAARAGAEVAKANPSVTAAQLTALNLFPTGITPTVTSVCTCVDNTWPAGAACPPDAARTPCTDNVTNPYHQPARYPRSPIRQSHGDANGQPDRFIWDLHICNSR